MTKNEILEDISTLMGLIETYRAIHDEFEVKRKLGMYISQLSDVRNQAEDCFECAGIYVSQKEEHCPTCKNSNMSTLPLFLQTIKSLNNYSISNSMYTIQSVILKYENYIGS